MRIIKNNFVKTGVVKYVGENDNVRLSINCKKDGSSFNVVGTIEDRTFIENLKYPYNYDGLDISYENGKDIMESDIPILKEMILKIEDWVSIAKMLYILSFSTDNALNYIDKIKQLPENEEIFKGKTDEECIMEVTGQMLTGLYTLHKDEMEEYVSAYLKFIGGEIKE